CGDGHGLHLLLLELLDARSLPGRVGGFVRTSLHEGGAELLEGPFPALAGQTEVRATHLLGDEPDGHPLLHLRVRIGFAGGDVRRITVAASRSVRRVVTAGGEPTGERKDGGRTHDRTEKR